MENLSSIMLNQRVNFEFAFNNANFSDRVIHIEIMDNSFDSNSERCTAVNVKTFHISSLLLAANSPFFHNLFKNGMRESKPTLRISASEEAGVMELLNFMYCNTLKATTIPDVLGVLVVADKFEARDCVRYCCELLQKMPTMSLESTLLYLKLPSTILMYEEVHPLMDAAKKCLLAHYKDINKFKEEAMSLPLSAIEVLLGSKTLQADLSEEDVFDFILKWAHAQYPQLIQRREALTKCLDKFIRFRYMSSSKLKEVLVCPDLDREQVSNLMLKAFIVLVEAPYGQNIHASNQCQVIKVEKSEPPQPRCIVYFDIKKEDCEKLSQSSPLHSQSFRLGGRSFYFSAQCCVREQRHSFGLYLNITRGSQSCSVEFEFEAMNKSSMMFQNKRKTQTNYSDLLMGWGFFDLFNIPWSDFIREESEYFLDEILHLRADITIKLDSQA